MKGFDPFILMVRRPEKPFFKNLLKTCEINDIPIKDFKEIDLELKNENLTLNSYIENKGYEFIIDSIFGYSFKPPIRPPFDYIINELKLNKIPKLSVDIPSGYDVEKGF